MDEADGDEAMVGMVVERVVALANRAGGSSCQL
jgi:hypothetical protein